MFYPYIKGNGLTFSIAIKPENKLVGFASMVLDVFDNVFIVVNHDLFQIDYRFIFLVYLNIASSNL